MHLLRGAVLAEPGPADVLGGQLLTDGYGGHQLPQVVRGLFLIP